MPTVSENCAGNGDSVGDDGAEKSLRMNPIRLLVHCYCYDCRCSYHGNNAYDTIDD